MLFGFSYVLDTANSWNGKGIKMANDPFLNKDIKNFGIYTDTLLRQIPTCDNKLPEHKLWKLNQPGHMNIPNSKNLATSFFAIPKSFS